MIYQKKAINTSKTLAVLFVLTYILSSLVIGLIPPRVYAADAMPNGLGVLGQVCQLMDKGGVAIGSDTDLKAIVADSNIDPDTGLLNKVIPSTLKSNWAKCEALQKKLKDNLGCSDRMFYDKVDPDDPSGGLNEWYTEGQKYSACYAAANAKITKIAGDTCKSMKHNQNVLGDDNNAAWNDCEKLQNQLADSIGCSKSMFVERKDKKGYYTQDAGKVADCKKRVAAAGTIQIPGPKGTEGAAAKTAEDNGYTGAEGEGDPADTAADCELTLKSLVSYVVCPLIDLGASLSDTVFESIIGPLLKNIPISSEPDDKGYLAWQQFRLIGNVLLVGSLLMVVYSQARGGK